MSSVFGRPSQSSSETRPDPTAQRLNTIVGDQLAGYIGATANHKGLENWADPNYAAVTPNPQAQSILDQLVGKANTGGGLPYNQAELAGYQDMQGGRNLAYAGYEKGLQEATKATDPTAGLAAAKTYMDRILGPTLTNQLTASGMGRSGAEAEALAQGAAGLALPVWQQTNANQFGLGNLYNQAATSYGNLAGDIGKAEMTLGSILDARQNANLKAGYEAAMLPQNAQYQEWLRPGNALLSLLGGVAMNPGATTISKSKGEEEGAIGQIMSLLGVAAMAGGMMGGSSETLKSDITPLEPETQQGIVDTVLSMPVKSWRYTGTAKKRVGPILEELPTYLRENPLQLDLVSLLGSLVVTVQAQQREINTLREQVMQRG